MAEFDLMKEEYTTLRKEVETAMSELNSVETQCIYAVTAVIVWLLTSPLKLNGAFLFAWFIPPVLVLFGAARCWSISKHLGWLGEYLSRIEEVGRRVDSLCVGWEHFLAEPDPCNPSRKRRGFRGKITISFWVILFLLSCLICGAGFVAQKSGDMTVSSTPPTGSR
jgi:hypothetical protein